MQGLLDGELPWFWRGEGLCLQLCTVIGERATQENLILAVAGLRSLLYAQYGPEVDLAIAPSGQGRSRDGLLQGPKPVPGYPAGVGEEAEQYAFDPRESLHL